ncbi:MAG TPA: asparagine synthase (glutamine-hydrolyzing), partial [Candidatus Polarisedimenticolia bacterium]|nr:asparagine synthase (glutamine-hydrolyzing) [Candidatus Polarisedimenticolia bacterium]
IIFNGEIYNYRELHTELAAAGHRFKTSSDTEVIVHAFEEWAEDCFRRLNGIFAFALCDARGRTPAFYLVRDRFGTKPLFYAWRDGRLAFASELKPLMEVPWVGRDVDRKMLFQFLKFSHVPSPHTILEGVRQVRPGGWLRFADGGLREGLYWDPIELSRGEPETARTEEEWLEELEAVLMRVVRRQMVSDVPLGCLLSGGIDSSLLTMACAATNGAKLQTFSIGYQESEFDETPYAREVANAFGTDHHELIVGPKDFLDLIPEVPRFFDQPLADPTLLSTLLLARFARKDVTVALSGDGGDELFFGYTYHQALLEMKWLLSLPAAPRKLLFAGMDSVLATLPAAVMSNKLQQARKASQILQFEDEAQCLAYFIGTIGPMTYSRLADLVVAKPDPAEKAFNGMLLELDGLPWEERIIQVFVRTFLPDTVLAKSDRACMAYALEARVPFLDDEMAALSARLPFNLKFRDGVKKYLLRKLLARKLPGRISGRSKQGFSIPLRDWLRTDLKYLLDEHLEEGRLKREGFFEPPAVARVVAEHVGGFANHSHLLWSLVTFQMWKAQYLS